MSNSLFNITNEMALLRNQLETENEFSDNEDEIQKIESNLKIKKEELSDKIQGYLHVINQSNAQANMALTEINRIQEFMDRKQHIADRLEGALLQALLLFGEEDKKGIKRLEVGTNRLSTRRSKSIEITNEELVTDDAKLCDVEFKNLTVDMKNFLASRIDDLPKSTGKAALLQASNLKIKISNALIKEKLKIKELDWANEKTTYHLTIK